MRSFDPWLVRGLLHALGDALISERARDLAPIGPRRWFKRCMFDRAFLGAPAVHRERAARLAGW